MKELILKKLEKYFTVEEKTTKEILNQLSLFIFRDQSPESDLYKLAEILSDEQLIKLLDYFDGATLKLPTKKKHNECLLLVLCYFLKEVEHYSWNEIKSLLKLSTKETNSISSVALGKKLNKLNTKLQDKMDYIINELSIDDIKKLVKKEKKNE